MFFRRAQVRIPTSADRLESLRQSGFEVAPGNSGNLRVSRSRYAIELKEDGEALRWVGRAGVRIGDETGSLVDGGYQKFFHTPSGIKKPALAEDLKALHDFEEDLKEAIGQESYYNESLGTV